MFLKRQGFGPFGGGCGCSAPNPIPMQMPAQMPAPMPVQCDPIIEPTKTHCVEKEFVHDVQHICPIHTHVINKHIYRHNYTPQYTMSEENQIINVDCGSCNQF